MVTQLATLLARVIEASVRWIVVPVTSLIPVLVSSGLMLLVFGAFWFAFATVAVLDPGVLDQIWADAGQLHLALQALAWLLLLPLMAGLWIWETDWPLLVRVGLVIALAAWNVLVFIPRREAAAGDSASRVAADAR